MAQVGVCCYDTLTCRLWCWVLRNLSFPKPWLNVLLAIHNNIQASVNSLGVWTPAKDMDTLPALLLHNPVLGVMSCTFLASIQSPDHLLQTMWSKLKKCATILSDSETLSMQMRR